MRVASRYRLPRGVAWSESTESRRVCAARIQSGRKRAASGACLWLNRLTVAFRCCHCLSNTPSMSDPTAPPLDLRWHKFPVLDDGFVCLVDWMGSDAAVVQAARVSYGEGTRAVSDDRTLIRYLMRWRHSTPFEMAELKFLVRVPLYLWQQWLRHRTASVNQESHRYSVADDAMQVFASGDWRAQSTTNRQGSGSGLLGDAGRAISEAQAAFQQSARTLYNDRIAAGVAREQARVDLPVSVYTQAYWKIDLHNLLHFLALRMDAHAQQEIRDYATIIGEQIVAPLFPLVWEAFTDYRLQALPLTGPDAGVIARLAATGAVPPYSDAAFLTAQDTAWQSLTRCRERDECHSKLVRLGLLRE